MNYPRPDKLNTETSATLPEYISVPGYANEIEVDATQPDPYTFEITNPSPRTFSAIIFPSSPESRRRVEISISNTTNSKHKITLLNPATMFDKNFGLPEGVVVSSVIGATSYLTLIQNIQASRISPKISAWDLSFLSGFSPEFTDSELAKCYMLADFKMIIPGMYGLAKEHFSTYNLTSGIITRTEFQSLFCPILKPGNFFTLNIPAGKRTLLRLDLFR